MSILHMIAYGKKEDMDPVKILERLKRAYPTHPMATFVHDPYQLLVAVMLSARSRDVVTIPAAKRLFTLAPTPQVMVALPQSRIEEVIKLIGFSKAKAGYAKSLSSQLLTRFHGKVPGSFDELVSLPGVGRKTANVVLGTYFKQDVIAVDTHVHRIANRLGWVQTTTPEETEEALKQVIPKRWWRWINPLLVSHGQQGKVKDIPR